MCGTFEEPPTELIPWFSKTEGNTYAALLHHPFLFKGKPTQCSRGSIGDTRDTLLFGCRVAWERPSSSYASYGLINLRSSTWGKFATILQTSALGGPTTSTRRRLCIRHHRTFDTWICCIIKTFDYINRVNKHFHFRSMRVRGHTLPSRCYASLNMMTCYFIIMFTY